MPNKAYRKGYEHERKIVNAARQDGKLAFRSAGSHFPVDCIIIDSEGRTIELIQAKAGKSLSENARRELEHKYKYLNGTYEVKFIVV